MESLRNQIKKMAMGCSSSNTAYDDEVDLTIASARADMIRLGVNEDLANADDDDLMPLIRQCIVFYGIADLSIDSADAEKAQNRYELLADQLRKSNGYKEATA